MMMLETKHIILMGFKHAGKSVVGKALANKIKREFIDLDQEIETHYHAEKGEKKTCREIMKAEGEPFFREQEQLILEKILTTDAPAVISLGGGAPLNPKAQKLIKTHFPICITAPKGLVFERIMIHGRPVFFSPDEDPFETFTRLWNAREPVYQELMKFAIMNDQSVEEAVQKIIEKIK